MSKRSRMEFDAVDDAHRRDKFCWKCHKDSNSEVECPKCDKSWHIHCEPDIQRTKTDWACRDCKWVEPVDRTKHLNFLRMDEAYEAIVETIYRPFGKVDIPYSDHSLELLNCMTLEGIKDKADNGQYRSTHELLMDFKWLQHNCEIMYKCCEKEHKPYHKDVLDSARRMLIKCEEELRTFSMCGECYMYRDNGDLITKLCPQPHLILWVQFDSYPYWPAKCISDTNGKLEVKFFKEHNTATVPYSKCYLYTKENPNVNDTKYKDEINEATQEAEEYIQEIEAKYGPFRYADGFIKPEKDKLDTDHLDHQIPGFRDSSNHHRIANTSSLHDSFDNAQQNATDDDLNMQENYDVGDKARPEPSSDYERLPLSITEGLRKCHQYIKLLHAEWQSGKEENERQSDEIERQRIEIEGQRKEIEALNKELENAKVPKCKQCSAELGVKFPDMCLTCMLYDE